MLLIVCGLSGQVASKAQNMDMVDVLSLQEDENMIEYMTPLKQGLALQETVSGQVVDASDGSPLPGVTVVVQGTTTGTSTDGDGNYSISVPDGGVLVFSFVGYESQTESVDGRSQIDIALEISEVLLDEAVVTAIGLERDRRSLGYSISQVRTDELVRGTEPNIANLLQGQVAGVNVAPTASGPGGSTRVTIRGTSSLSDDNQPLYVVDGIPIDNSNIGSVGKFGGIDGGDGIQSINPDDIESISVLKGASASALYGERARDGVILITTKTGSEGQVSVNFSNNTTFERACMGHRDYQTTYGQGSQGRRPISQEDALQTNLSHWGEKFDGQPTIQWDGIERPYEDLGYPLADFYRTGFNTRSNLSVMGGAANSTYFFSASQLNNESIIEGSDLSRTSLTVRGTSTIGRLSADLKANYIDENTNNRQRINNFTGNVQTTGRLARNVPLSSLEENYKDELGREVGPTTGDTNNPYWLINEFDNWDERNRLIGHVKLDFRLTDWLDVTGRTGLDWSSLRRDVVWPWGTLWRPLGEMFQNEWRIRESNTDLFLNGYYELTPSITIDGILGGSLRNRRNEQTGTTGSSFTVPGLNTISNLENTVANYSFSEKEIRSIYGNFNIGYNDYLFMTLTGRQDWSSTLPVDNNSFFYPSVSSSFLFSELFELPQWLSHGQLRASWAEVGSDTNPYQLALTYALLPRTHLGRPIGRVAQSSVPLSTLKPTITQEVELGFDVRFFDDRLGVDFAWYDKSTTNQILSTQLAQSSGFGGRVINAGQVDNTGFEILLTTRPVARPDFFWRSSLNYGRNKSMIVELVEGQEIFTFEESRSENAWITAQEGHEFGTIRGFALARDEEGNVIHQNGLPVRGDLEILGRGTPDWTMGWSNTVSFKNYSLNILIDAEWGGQLYSFTNARLYSNGQHPNTLVGRAACDDTKGPDGRWADDCFIGEGVDIDGGPNTTGVLVSSYYSRLGSQLAEPFVYDRNMITMRQIQLSYNLPIEWISSLGIQAASISLVGRNLFFIYNSVPNVDPSGYNRGNAQGLESESIPHTRSLGFNIDLRF